MVVTLFGIVTFVNPPGTATSVFPSFVNKRPEVDLKEGLPESTEKDIRLVQPLKALTPMLVTLSGIVMLVKDSQPLKACSPMLVTGLPPSFEGMVRAPDDFGETPVITAPPSLIFPIVTLALSGIQA